VSQYEGTVYNFNVKEDHSYVTDRTIVHNCIGAMEAQAAGLKIVSSSKAALNETVADRGILIDGEPQTEEYQNKFIEASINALTNTTDQERLELQNYAENNFSIVTLAKDWENMFYKLYK
jgi:glycosyltransferase involved in cell wall biosynthesis